MLSNLDVNIHLYKCQKHFVNSSSKNTGTNPDVTRFLVKDSDDKRIIAVCENIGAAAALTGFDTVMYTTKVMGELAYSEAWKLIDIGSSWVESLEFESVEQLERLLLINQKAYALDSLYAFIDDKRLIYTKHNQVQNQVYSDKYQEAVAILKDNVKTDEINKFPYVNSYAKYKCIDLVDAAKEVVFKKESLDCILAQLELLRIEYTNRICKQTTLQDLKTVFDSFLEERNIKL